MVKNHEKIEPLSSFFKLQLYYKFKIYDFYFKRSFFKLDITTSISI